MCGICGFSGENNSSTLKSMNSCLVHRGPDDSGFFEDTGISLGHRRLKIIDLSSKAAQPMQNEDETVTVVFNGEIYNYRELKKELEKNHKFKSDSDTEVLVHLYEEKGVEMFSKLDGMFSLAIWDSTKKTLLIARDPLGIKPLYYKFQNNQLFFASEIKSILASNVFEAQPDLIALNDLLCFRVVLGDKTLFRGIKKLPAGHYLKFNDKVVIAPYWKLEVLEQNLNENQASKKFLNLFEKSVKKRLISDVPLGAYLSGGLDSSAIVATMSKMIEQPVKTFTVGFGLDGDEFGFAKRISDKFNTDHTEVKVEFDEMTNALPKLVWNMDEPMADIAFLPVYFLTKRARKDITVSLLGEGADELFAGYKRYQHTTGPFRLLPKKFRALSYINQDIAFRYPERSKVFSKKFKATEKVEEEMAEKYFSDKKNFLNQALLFDTKELLPNYQLTRVDRVTMSCGMEARVPFLDKELTQFAFSLPQNLKLNKTGGKFIVKKAFEGILPQEILREKKRIFFIPLKKWFDESFFEVAKQLLDERKLEKRGIFSSSEIKKKFSSQKKGLFQGRNSNQLLMLSMIEIWFQTFIDRKKQFSDGLSLNQLE